MRHLCALLLVASAAVSVSAQTAVTATFDDTTELNSSVRPQGGSLPCIGSYGSCQILKNLVGALNPSFEGLQIVDTWTVPANGTGTVKGSPVSYSTQAFYVPTGGSAILQSRWVDNPAGKRVVDVVTDSISNPSNVGCVDYPTALSLSAGDNAMNSMTLTFAAGNCPSPKQGDTHTIMTAEIPATGTAAPSGSVFTVGGATLTYNSTTPLNGLTSMEMNTLPAGSGAGYSFYFDTELNNRLNLDGTYQVSLKAKNISGPGTFTVQVKRNSATTGYCLFAGGANSVTFTATSSSQTLTASCTMNESTTKPEPAQVQLSIGYASQTDFLFDDVDFRNTSGQDSTNTTVLRDEVIDGLRAQWYLGKRGTLRYGPLLQNCMTYANWIKPDGQRLACTVNPTGGIATANVNLSFGDWLHVNEVLGADAYWHLPATITAADAVKLYEFDYATTNADRTAFGHATPYGGPGGVIADQDIAFGNEMWNDGNIGQNMHFPMPSGSVYTVYLDYDASINAAIYADAAWQPAYTNLLANYQYQNPSTFMTDMVKMKSKGGAPSGAELSPYYGFTNTSCSTDESCFRAGLSQAYMQTNTSGSAFASAVAYLRSSSSWGPSGTAAPKLYVYEMANGDSSPCSVTTGGVSDQPGYPACQAAGNALLDATNLQLMNVGAANGIVAADEYVELLKAGFSGLNLFALNSYGGPSQRSNPATAGTTFYEYQYGASVGFGDATATLDGLNTRPRPQMLGTAAAHFAVVGSHLKNCTTTSPTYSQVAGPSPIYQVAATTGIPYLTCARFSDGANLRGVVFVNKSTSTTYTVTLAGSSLPTGAVTGLQFAPSSLHAINEAAATLPTGIVQGQLSARTDTSAATMANVALSLNAPTTITVPPGVTGIAYSTVAAPKVLFVIVNGQAKVLVQ